MERTSNQIIEKNLAYIWQCSLVEKKDGWEKSLREEETGKETTGDWRMVE